jgi:hypothetical protein
MKILKLNPFYILIIMCLTLTGCADSVQFTITNAPTSVGFGYGLWHGIIAPIAFFISLFDDSTAMYAIYNDGGWYDFGFLLGLSCSWITNVKQ